MIEIGRTPLNANELIRQYPSRSPEAQMIRQLSDSRAVYRYASIEELKFELDVRKNTVDAALALHRSRLAFRVFRQSRCNEAFWTRTEEGGFRLKSGVSPSSAIRDIYTNSHLYATECSTAIVIVFYKAILESIPEGLFNDLYREIYLMNWKSLDSDLYLRYFYSPPDYLPGDCRYIRNPDVNPLTPEWQGENVIYLGDELYYGHGIGIGTADLFIQALNRNRIRGSETSAYLMDDVTHPDYKALFGRYERYNR